MENSSNNNVSWLSRYTDNIIISLLGEKISRAIFKVIILFVLISPTFVFAASHTYSCSDFPLGTASCTDDLSGHAVVTYTGGDYVIENYDSGSNCGLVFPTCYNGTYHFTITVTGSGGAFIYLSGDTDGTATTFSSTGAYTVSTFTGTDSHLVMQSSDFIGTLSNLCVDDDGSSCGEPPIDTSSPSPTATSSQYLQFYGTIGLFTTMMIGLLQLFFILIVLWIMIIVFGWPIKIFWKGLKGLLGMGFYDRK